MEPKSYYRHFRLFKSGRLLPKGGVTLHVTDYPTGVVQVKAAVCSEKDHYNKHKGRKILEQRDPVEIRTIPREQLRNFLWHVAREQLHKVSFKDRNVRLGMVERRRKLHKYEQVEFDSYRKN